MGLRDTYAYAIQTAKGKFQGNAVEEGGKLHFKGTVATDAEKNEIWNAIKTIPTWQNDIVADIKVTGTSRRRRACGRGEDLHRQGRRYAEQDRQGSPWQCGRVHEDFRSEQRSAERSGQDQAGTGLSLP